MSRNALARGLDRTKFPGINTVRKRLADGTVLLLRYHREAKRRIYSEPGTPAFAAEYERILKGWTPEPRRPRRCFVYFVQAEITRRIKIGKAGQPVARMAALQVGSPDRLIMLGVVLDPSAGALEAELHAKFRKHRFHGEWFDPADGILDFIEAHTHVPGRKRVLHKA